MIAVAGLFALLPFAPLTARADTPASPVSSGAPAPPAAPDEPAEVRLRSPDPRVILERRPIEVERRGDLAGVDGWVPVCIAPCGVKLGRAERLRVAGSGVDPSDGFLLPKGPGPFTIEATTGSAGYQTAGLVLVVTGGAMLVLGGFSLLALEVTGATKNAGADSAAAKMQIASITTLILSAAVFGVGVPFRFSARTRVKIEPPRTSRSAPRLTLGPGYLLF